MQQEITKTTTNYRFLFKLIKQIFQMLFYINRSYELIEVMK